MREQDRSKDTDTDKDKDMDGDRNQMPLPTMLVLLRRIKRQLLTRLSVKWMRGHRTRGHGHTRLRGQDMDRDTQRMQDTW